MRFIKQLSIKKFLMGVVGLLSAILILQSVLNVADTYSRSREIARIDVANELADDLLTVAGSAAVERGVTSSVLSSGSPADTPTLKKITELRDRVDGAYRKAGELMERLAGMDEGNTLLAIAGRSLAEARASFDRAREMAEREFGRAAKEYPTRDWIAASTAFIEATSEVRAAAFTSRARELTYQEALRMNIEVKQAVWLVSEYAGRERATLAAVIGSRRPVDAPTMERLNTFRAIVDLNMKTVLRLRDTPGTDPAVLRDISAMESGFLGAFGEVRRSVYSAASTGEYPLSGKEWIEKSTAAIDTVLAVSASIGEKVDEKITADLAASKREMAVSVAFLALVAGLSAFTFWVINNKVVSPLHYLSGAMEDIERTGDLTTAVAAGSGDECGKVASAFNGMIRKFHDVLREVHASVERLASSSEELSATSVQIAGGTKAQSAKAVQVSTAAQEMSATITEVAKNVFGAAEAAKEASTVAQKGGEIVERTIGSMNGIAGTARESSRMISMLGGRSREIGSIINVIEDIADQTNLLALNAAIEAARAGEQGRGFAVVADEVRNLAEKTIGATKEIGSMIKAMQDDTNGAIASMEKEVKAVEGGVELARQAGEALKEIVGKVDVVTSMIRQISTASEEQSAATGQISTDIETVANVITENSAGAAQIAQASREIAELAAALKTMVEVFKVSGERGKVVEFKRRRNAAPAEEPLARAV